MLVKVVFAATVEQEQEIASLVEQCYHSVFPKYFINDEIIQFQEVGILQATKNGFPYNGTLRSAFQVITCLQVIISVLEKKEASPSLAVELKLQEMFRKNTILLNEYGILFPFDYQHFIDLNHENQAIINSMYTQPANRYLV